MNNSHNNVCKGVSNLRNRRFVALKKAVAFRVASNLGVLEEIASNTRYPKCITPVLPLSSWAKRELIISLETPQIKSENRIISFGTK